MAGRAPGEPGGWVQFSVEERDGGRLVGDVGISPAEGEPGVIKVGYTISPDVQGRGYATEAVQALVDYALRHARRRGGPGLRRCRQHPLDPRRGEGRDAPDRTLRASRRGRGLVRRPLRTAPRGRAGCVSLSNGDLAELLWRAGDEETDSSPPRPPPSLPRRPLLERGGPRPRGRGPLAHRAPRGRPLGRREDPRLDRRAARRPRARRDAAWVPHLRRGPSGARCGTGRGSGRPTRTSRCTRRTATGGSRSRRWSRWLALWAAPSWRSPIIRRASRSRTGWTRSGSRSRASGSTS